MKLKIQVAYEVSENGFLYRTIRTEEDFRMALNIFFDVFLREEPASKAAFNGGGAEVARDPQVVDRVSRVLAHGVSILALDRSNKLPVGIRTAVVINKYSKVSI